MRILLFGTKNLQDIPMDIREYVHKLGETYSDCEFLLGDKVGVDSAFHKVLSSYGYGDRSKVYCLDGVHSNKFELPVKEFRSYYYPEKKWVNIRCGEEGEVLEEIFNVEAVEDIKDNSGYWTFIDKQLIKDCDLAIGVSLGPFYEDKRLSSIVQLCNIYKKQIYILTVG